MMTDGLSGDSRPVRGDMMNLLRTDIVIFMYISTPDRRHIFSRIPEAESQILMFRYYCRILTSTAREKWFG
jgi:hypothetical protein